MKETHTHAVPRPRLGWLLVVVPTFVAAVSWPLFCLAIKPGGFIFMPVVWIVTSVWSCRISNRLAAWTHARRVAAAESGKGARPSPFFRERLALILGAAQLVAIFATLPAFLYVLELLEQMGYGIDLD